MVKCFVFCYLGLAVDNNMDTILKIMLSNLNPDKDPEVRLKFLTTLAKHLEVFSKGATLDNMQLQIFVKRIIEGKLIIHPPPPSLECFN